MAFIGDETGAAPTALTDAAPWLIPVDQQHQSGAANDTLTFDIDLDRLKARYQDILVPVAVDRTVELREVRNGSVDRLLGWAKLATNSVNLTGSRETSTITCRLDETALELLPVTFAVYIDGPTSAEVPVEEDLIFNPQDQTNVRGNRSTLRDTNGAYAFLDPLTVRTTQSLAVQGQNPKRWTLAQAVHTLCWLCNPNETRLLNPTVDYLSEILDDPIRDAQFLNHRVPRGTGLLKALNDLLLPYSCSFYLDAEGTLGNTTTKIKVFELGAGLTESVRLQRIGQTMDAAKTDTASVQMKFDIAAQPNRIHAVSARRQFEYTLKLYPAWDPDDDPVNTSGSYLDGYDELANNPDYQPGGRLAHVGRRWAANEAGDYVAFRTSQATPQKIGGTSRMIRRPLLPCLTRAADGHQIGNHGVLLEWQDFDGVWHEETAGFDVLDDEAGIIYSSSQPPIEVWINYNLQPESYALRVTACVELDDRVSALTARRDDSPQGQDHWLYLPLDHRFAERRLWDTGTQKSRFFDDRTTSLVSVSINPSNGDWNFTLADDVSQKLKPGQKLALVDSIREGVYTAKGVDGFTVTVEEDASAIEGASGAVDRVFLNTDCEGCADRMNAFALRARDDNDFALVAPTIDLAGIDHPQYQIGKLVPSAQPRHVEFAGRRGGERAPQIVGISRRFQSGQSMTLQLEQVREVLR